MNGLDIAIIVIVSVAVAGVFGWIVYRKVKHKNVGCDCGCGSCSGCSACNGHEGQEDKK